MISLFLNTSSSYLNTFIFDENKVLDELNIKYDRDLSKETLSKIKEMLDKNNLSPNDIEKVICVKGPGSFTGLRISATIAKTYTYFLNKKLYSVSNLYVMATSVKNELIVPIIDARRGYVYGAIYDENYNEILKEQYISLNDLKEKVNSLNKKVVYVSNDTFDDLETVKYNPDSNNFINNLKIEEEDPIFFIPNYLKKVEAEEKLNDKRN